jgi:hypothetical protein
MGIGSIVNLAGGYLQSLFPSQSATSSATPTSGSTSAAPGATGGNTPFAQILSQLQQLEQSNPTQYASVTQQISTSLQTAAQSATTAGQTGLANQLTQLSSDFNSASTSGQLPNVQDLASAIGGGGHHHHHFGGAASATTNSATSPANTSPASNVDQFLQTLGASQNGAAATGSLNPTAIILNTLSTAGIQV